jgi:hypothetical protein
MIPRNRHEQPHVEHETLNKKWDELSGDEEIMGLVGNKHNYLGHSTGSIDWLTEGKDLRVSGGGIGSLSITAIEMPNAPTEFLAHLKKRVDSKMGYYHLGQYVVVLAVPPDLYKSYGQNPDADGSDPLGTAMMKNVKVIEKEGSHYSAPKRFILGYYDGSNNTFYRNPKWEEKPEATEFGIEAEDALNSTASNLGDIATPDIEPRTEPVQAIDDGDIDDIF